MNAWQAIQNFWESFDIPAYDENSVPDDAVLPYITYNASIGKFESPIPLTGSIWYRSTSWKDISLKANEIIESVIPYKLIKLDNNEYIHVVRGSPVLQRMTDPDASIKRIYINLMAEFYMK